MTRCFGSVCFGALLVSIIEVLQEGLTIILHDPVVLRRNILTDFICYSLRKILSFLGWLLQYFNKYSFSYLSIHGTGYLNSSRKVFKLFKIKGLELLANNCIIDGSVKMYLILLTLLSGLTSFYYIKYMMPILYQEKMYLFLLISVNLLMAFHVGWTLLNVINACVHVLFICLSQCSDILEKYHPNENKEIINPLTRYRGFNQV